ncbi:hypothetical protein SAMN05216275_1419 [Streptosporangium canum]|uniref:Uncharacterized protein n=1 Tax=Streptosporangium canum TaxID=324952 RepID=A0A1I4DCI0_9ACTN|nr:hypothetical protein [Streptosporangium canum]SFK91524.1 hypothetical protein SAMN05216275_1419 [Streptosporangium canum]
MSAPAAERPTENRTDPMTLARRIAELELQDYLSLPQRLRSEQHRLRIDLENLLYPFGPYNVAAAAADALMGEARAEQRARGER